MPSPLPDFDRPPVVEVAIGVQFEPVALSTPHLGLLWQGFRERLPRIEEKPPLDPVVERFGVRPRPSPPKFTLLEQPPPNRAWFLNEAGDELIQVQRDRLIFNWRKVDDGVGYPRYEAVESSFFAAYETFTKFVDRLGSNTPRITQCEVTYVNHIRPAEGVWSDHGEAGHAVTLVSATRHSFLPKPEDIRAATRFVIMDRQGASVGRLHVLLEPRWYLKEDRPLLFLQLTARGAPRGEGLDGARTFFRLGREWIVRGFVDVTSQAMHQVWGRR